MNIDDSATEIEIMQREAAIKNALAQPVERMCLDCEECSGITQAQAGATCQDYLGCVEDWRRIHFAAKRNGI